MDFSAYSIRLDVLRALIEQRQIDLLAMKRAEAAKPDPDAVVIAALDDEIGDLPTYGEYPEEQHIDDEIERWRAPTI